ncbi:MAG: flagellar biosynthesis protein [Pseudorhodobacter sp.]|nr:flagellar biosynthesis protein [Rhizobacter sp.]
MTALLSRPAPFDQAHGLRQRFSSIATRFIPVVSNPHVAFSGVMLERLCTAFGEQGRHTLVIDAAETSPNPSEMMDIDLADCIELISPQVSYLAARGAPLRYVDARGSTASFLQAAADAAPQSSVVLVHATAADLCRLFMRTEARPLLLADDRPSSVTHAYAAMKLLTQRAGLVVYDLMLCAEAHSPRSERIAMQLATCGDDFLGAVLRNWLHVDPATDATDAPTEGLMHWARESLQPTWQTAMDLPQRSGNPAMSVPMTHAEPRLHAMN